MFEWQPLGLPLFFCLLPYNKSPSKPLILNKFHKKNETLQDAEMELDVGGCGNGHIFAIDLVFK